MTRKHRYNIAMFFEEDGKPLIAVHCGNIYSYKRARYLFEFLVYLMDYLATETKDQRYKDKKIEEAWEEFKDIICKY